jgi:hypothetical protein
LLNRNPNKRLGSGPADADEIKIHKFFQKANINWDDAYKRKLPVPPVEVKKIFIQDIPNDKVYGRGAYDAGLKNINRVNEWSFVQKQ